MVHLVQAVLRVHQELQAHRVVQVHQVHQVQADHQVLQALQEHQVHQVAQAHQAHQVHQVFQLMDSVQNTLHLQQPQTQVQVNLDLTPLTRLQLLKFILVRLI